MNYFSQPYPHADNTPRQKFLIAIGAGTFVAFVLIVFQPFGTSQWNDPLKLIKLIGYGIVTFLFVMAINFLIPRYFKKWYLESEWTIKREILWNLLLIVSITFGNLSYNSWLFGIDFHVRNILLWLGMTASIGIVPVIIVTLSNYNWLLRKYSTDALQTKKSAAAIVPSNGLTLSSDNEKDTLTLSAGELLFIESADNYSQLVFWRENKIQKMLLRGSLTRMEEQIQDPNIVRCHRSYIINLGKVETITGNAQGYKLQLQNWTQALPVARRYTDVIAQYFKK